MTDLPVVYAMINTQTDYVEGVVTINYEHTPESSWVVIPTEDQSLIGKWYNPADGQFYDKPHGYLIRLKTVDGADSGLDADTLDGNEASAFALADHTHTGFADANHDHDSDYAPITHTHEYLPLAGGCVTGTLEVSNLIKCAGQQAIYSLDGTTNMQVGTGNLDLLLNANNDVFVQTRMNTRSMVPNANDTYQIGNTSLRYKGIYLTANPNVSSDERLKQDIEAVDTEDMLAFIDKLNVVNYAYKDDPDKERIGLIAQQVEAAGGEKFVEIGENGYYGLFTADFVYPLIGAVQALSKRVKELEDKIKE